MTQLQLNDGLTSLATNLGKRQEQLKYTSGTCLTDDKVQLDTLWKQNWIVQKICNKKARDMTRKWRDIFSNDLEAEHLEKIESIERKIKLKETLEKACVWASLYGGVAILVLTEKNTTHPLKLGQSIEKLIILEQSKVQPKGERNENVFDDNFGKYDIYTVNGRIDVHYSRLLFINAVERPLEDQHNKFWGLSDIEQVYDVLKRYDALGTNTGDLVQESKVDVFKMDGLTNKLAAGFESDIAKAMTSIQL
ncbi:anti-CBASS protein Acb1 family protein, partial [Pasteurella multocida]